MAYNAKTERLIALKKLAGKAQTSNDKGLANEGLPSGITSTSETIFGESITTAPSAASLYTITGKVEYVRFPTTFIAGSDTSDGRHGFELKLPSDYESNSSNAKAGTYPFTNNQVINITSGSLQIIPPSFAVDYEAKPFYGGSSVKDSGTQIPVLDARDWYLDYFNAVFFQQDPPGTGDHANNPDYVEAYLYIGDYLSETAAGNITGVTAGTGLTGGGSSGNVTLAVDNSVVATLTGSQFTGNVGVTGSFLVKSGDFTVESVGEDQALFLDASSNQLYINKGATSFTTIVKNTNNEVFRAGAGGAIFNEYGNKHIDFRIESWDKPYAFYIDSQKNQVLILSGGGVASPNESTFTDMNFFVSGSIGSRNSTTKGTSIFGGDVLSSGSLTVMNGLSGSLTKLTDGTSYLRAGSNITITSGSGGFITVASSGGGGTPTTRAKDSYFLASQIPTLQAVPVASSDFSDASYDSNLIDILLNGQLLHSGSGIEVAASERDYYVTGPSSLKFAFQLDINDVIDVIVYKVTI